jgi:hypothetical protein
MCNIITMNVTCYLTAKLPRTGGDVRIGVPCQKSKRGLRDGVQELVTMYHRYPVIGAQLHLVQDEKVLATGTLVEGPKLSKKDQAELFVQDPRQTYRLQDWLEKVQES